VIGNTTDLIFFGLVGIPMMLAGALIPFAVIERYYGKRGLAAPSYRTVAIVRTMAAIVAAGLAISALRYLTGF
jgi:hypothetical protein